MTVLAAPKNFITFAMGSSSKGETRSLCRLNGINDVKFDALVAAAEKLYPRLELFNGWGIYAQNYEGQILKQVMLEGIKQDIVCLAVHDAVAVRQEHLK